MILSRREFLKLSSAAVAVFTLLPNKTKIVPTIAPQDLFNFPVVPEAEAHPVLDWNGRLARPFPATQTFGSVVEKVTSQTSNFILEGLVLKNKNWPRLYSGTWVAGTYKHELELTSISRLSRFKLFAYLVGDDKVRAATGLVGPDFDLLVQFARGYGERQRRCA